MVYIFRSLSITSLALVFLTLTYGLWNGDYNGLVGQLRQARSTAHPSVGAGDEGAAEGPRVPQLAAGSAAKNDLAAERGHDAQPSAGASAQLDPRLLAELRRVQWHTRNHMLLGVLAAVVTALVQCVGVTYFIGTSRWVKEVADAYALDPVFVETSSRIKRSAFPFAILGIAAVLTIAALGAASDPGTLRPLTERWVMPHYTAALTGFCVIAFSLYRQAGAIHENQQLIDDVMLRVREARIARKLEV
jgi:hypothetical protein